MTTPLSINGLLAAVSSNNLSTSCVLSIQEHEPESQNDNDTEQSTEVDNMINVVYEDETDVEAIF